MVTYNVLQCKFQFVVLTASVLSYPDRPNGVVFPIQSHAVLLADSSRSLLFQTDGHSVPNDPDMVSLE